MENAPAIGNPNQQSTRSTLNCWSLSENLTQSLLTPVRSNAPAPRFTLTPNVQPTAHSLCATSKTESNMSLANNPMNVPGIEQMIARGLQQVIDEEIEKVVEEAKRKVEANVRASSAGIAARVLKKFTMNMGMGGDELVIRVEFPGAKD